VALTVRIPDFAIERLLSHRADGSAVYVARDVRSGERVALRVVDLAGRPDAVRELMRAVALWRALLHAGLAEVVDAGPTPEGAWIATRLVDGESLADTLDREGALAPAPTLAILAPVASALDAAHALGLVCDSLAPRAVRIVEERGGTVRGVLTDVGPPWPAALRPGRLLGDVDGLAPEEIRGDAPTPRSNVYALGALLVRCLTGEPPFPARFRPETLAAHLGAPPPRPSARVAALPAALDDLVDSALAKEPAARPASAGELIAWAADVLEVPLPRAALAPAGSGAVATPPARSPARAARPPAPPAHSSRTRIARRIALLVPVAALIAVGVWAATRSGGGSAPRATRGVPTEQAAPVGAAATSTLLPPRGSAVAGGPTGDVRVVTRGARRLITIAGERLPPEGRNPAQAYAVWLFNSRRSAVRLGFVVPPVGTSGRFVSHRELPSSAERYRLVVVTLESSSGRLPTGPIVLQGALPQPPVSATGSG
jgi:Protein kinase domain